MWTVYALYNREIKKIYIGETRNIDRRLKEHNKKLGKHFTAVNKGTWELIYKEQTDTRNKALIRERQLKSYRRREFIKKFIKD